MDLVKGILKHSIIVLILGGVAGVLLLTAVWLIPDKYVERGVKDAANVFQNEGTDEHEIQFNFYTYGSKLISDINMTEGAGSMDKNLNPLEKAMSINGYSRYWHGYLVIYRPLLALFNYGQIRYIMTMAFVILLALIVIGLYERCGKAAAFIFVLSLGIVNFTAVPFSLHASMAFFVTFGEMVFFLKYYNGDRSPLWRWLFYLISGMVMSYTDFLTTPITGLAMPLLLELMIDEKENRDTGLLDEFRKCIFGSAAWCLGYAFFWAEKWLLGSLVLKSNIVTNAAGKVNHWFGGNEDVKSDALWALKKNIACLFPFGKGLDELLPFIWIYVIILIVLIVYFIKNHRTKDEIVRLLPILFVAAYPYFWIICIYSHSALHATFWVYRIQICAIFGFLTFYSMATKNKRSKE